MLSSSDGSLAKRMELEQWLSSKGIWHRFIDKAETIHTADASKQTGIALDRLTKNLVARTNAGDYVLLIVPGNKKVDLKKAADQLGVRNISLIPLKEAEGISGYPPGGTPSLFHKTRMKVVFDRSLLHYETIFCGGGATTRILELKVTDVIGINAGLVCDVLKEEESLSSDT
jgi:Cys-tRNA(Pro)/Cys-tRNA(Cys) deacylase